LIYQSVSRELHNRGLNGAMLYRTAQALIKAGYARSAAPGSPTSTARRCGQAEKVGARPLHRLHLFTKPLAARA